MHLSNVSSLILSFVDLFADDKTAGISNKNNMRAAPMPYPTCTLLPLFTPASRPPRLRLPGVRR
jgi:hypothetical protein